MIVFNLICGAGHRFEAWFASTASYDEQAASGLVACPHCQDTTVSRVPSAPNLRRSAPGVAVTHDVSVALAQALARLSREAEDVGERFPEEARRIHYHETAERNIRGQASLAQTLELLEEGIPVLPLPKQDKDRIH